MFARLPNRKRRTVYVSIKRKGNTIDGDSDLQSVIYRDNPETMNNIKILTSHVNESKEQLAASRAEIARLNGIIAANNNTIASLTDSNAVGSANANANAKNATVLQQEISSLRAQLESVKAEYKECGTNVTQLSSEYQQALKNKDSNVAVLRVELQDAVNAHANVVQESQKLRQDLQVALQTLDTLKRANNQTDAELSNIRNETMRLNAELSKVRGDLVAAQTVYKDCVSSGDATKKELQALLNEIAIQKQRYVELSREVKNCGEKTELVEQLIKENTRLAKVVEENAIVEKNAQSILQSDTRDLAKQCTIHKTEMIEILRYLSRQNNIFNLVSNSEAVKRSSQWRIFDSNNRGVYEMATSIIQNYSDNIPCDQIATLHQFALQAIEKVRALENILTNLYEDIVGAVRVYVRIKPGVASKRSVGKDGKSVRFFGENCGLKSLTPGSSSDNNSSNKVYGRFFGVIPESFNNADFYTGCADTVYDKQNYTILGHNEPSDSGAKCCIANDASGICRVIDQLSSGYHVVMLGYGYSGSGKTHTLLGDSTVNEPGIAQLAVANAVNAEVHIRQVFELAFDKIDFRSKQFNSGKFINLYKRAGVKSIYAPPTATSGGGLHYVDVENKFLSTPAEKAQFADKLTGATLASYTQKINRYRLEEERIKPTVNNPQSSRSHLFVMLDFIYSDGKHGMLTIVDMGGRESPFDILRMFLDKPVDKSYQFTSLLMNDKTLYPKYLAGHAFTPDDKSLQGYVDTGRYNSDVTYARVIDSFVKNLNRISTNIETVITLLKESVYINETVNALILYLKGKNEPNAKFSLGEMTLPLEERRNPYDPLKLLAGDPSLPGKPDRMGMYKILSALDSIGGGKSKSKFVMICNVRSEVSPLQFCEGTRDTLEFAHSIRST